MGLEYSVKQLLLLIFIAIKVASIPPPVPQQTLHDKIRPRPRVVSHQHDIIRRELGDFKTLWVTQCGFGNVKQDGVPAVKVEATQGVSDDSLQKAARLVFLMCRFMRPSVFLAMSDAGVGVGVFAKGESITEFPEFSFWADTPECSGTCVGDCAVTCTGNRKYSELAGLGGYLRAAVVETNLICDPNDDVYLGYLNVLAHEFAHTIHSHLDPTEFDVNNAYATNSNNWDAGSYATSNVFEYWAESTTAFFMTSKMGPSSTGGLNYCGDSVCTNETAARANVETGDSLLYNILSDVYLDSRDELPGRMTPCDW